ncbi:hypothetical protein ACHAWC_011801 [Mediolabrus comicus]
MVEYWSRSNYINLDAHSDIDENTLKEEGVLRCPRHGHVLYLQIANCEEVVDGGSNDDASTATEEEEDNKHDRNRMGPTVVFNRKVAWGSVTPRTIPSSSSSSSAVVGLASHNSPINMKDRVQEYIVDVENYWDEETKRQYGLLDNNSNNADNDDGDSSSSNVKEEKMAIVPAVNGRLLRFDGAAFHSVPKPPHRYLLSEDELIAYLEKDCEEDCEEDDDDYWDDDEGDYWDNDNDDDYEKEDLSQQRSVILFNTWPAGSNGPRGVLPDCVVEAVPDGIMLEDDNTSIEDDRIAEQWTKWNNEYGPNAEKLHCTPVRDWKLCAVDDLDGDGDHKTVVVPLMGNPTRRGTSKTKALLQGQGINQSAFYDGRKVSMATLREL